MTRTLHASTLATFFEMESAGGIMLFLASVLAVILANSMFAPYYHHLLATPVAVQIGALSIAKPLLLWINDGLMAVFFLLVGLELKRELLDGDLATPGSLLLPGAGAVGGMVVPALIYLLLNRDDAFALQGWAIPMATDIAFALGVLALLGRRVPPTLKIFLTSLAIFDDLGAIVVIAVLYTANISLIALGVALMCVPVLLVLNRRGVTAFAPYLVVGLVMWVATLKSGVHATLAGVVLAMFIPLRSRQEPDYSPLRRLERSLHGVVAYAILPLFAFANTGLDLRGVTAEQVLHGVPVGIALGLFVGKQIGVFGSCWLAAVVGRAALPQGMSWRDLYGTAVLCGVGFTMSLFIGSLAFEETGINDMFDQRLGIILGSLASGICGYLVLRVGANGRGVTLEHEE